MADTGERLGVRSEGGRQLESQHSKQLINAYSGAKAAAVAARARVRVPRLSCRVQASTIVWLCPPTTSVLPR